MDTSKGFPFSESERCNNVFGWLFFLKIVSSVFLLLSGTFSLLPEKKISTSDSTELLASHFLKLQD